MAAEAAVAAIKLTELKSIVDTLFDHAIEKSGDGVLTISSERDYYWCVPTRELFAMDHQPSQLEVGRLSDDWGFLQPLLVDKQQVFSLMFIHIAPLLQYLAAKSGD